MQRLESLFSQREQEEQERFEDEEEEEEGGGRRRVFLIGAALVAIALAVVFIAYAYVFVGEPGGNNSPEAIASKPLIAADLAPYRIAPEKPGGITIDHQDVTLLNRSGNAPATGEPERLLPPAEVPLPRPGSSTAVEAGGPRPATASPPPPPPSITGGPPVSALPEASTRPVDLLAAARPTQGPAPTLGEVPINAPPASTGGLGGAGPGAGVQGGRQPAAPAAAPPTTQAPPRERMQAIPPVPLPGASAGSGASVPSSPTRQTAPQTASLPPASLPTAIPATPAPATAQSGGGYKVQLASLRDSVAVSAKWSELQGQHRDVLGSLSLTPERADLPGRGTFIRLQAGPFPSRNDAQAACTRLRSRGVDCVVVAPR